MLGLIGVLYVMIFGWGMLHQPKPVHFRSYPMPSFFGDGYGVIRRLFEADFYTSPPHYLILLLCFLVLAKILATVVTLSTGGSGGIIAPSLFLGAAAGGFWLVLCIFIQDRERRKKPGNP